MKEKVIHAIQNHRMLLDKFESQCVDTIISISQVIVDCLNSKGRIYICGNGGSAADSQHIAAELVNRFKKERKLLPAIALTTDTSVITSIANDYSFEDIFSKQVEALMTSRDILWAFSTSGTSKNVVKAAEVAKSFGAKVIAFTGKADSTLEKISDMCVCIEAEYASDSQEIHQLAYHIICGLVEDAFA
jgi:D-sedoheptulose 7-phosphate isomerase